MSQSPKPATLDPLVHEAARLAMVAALAACDRANFNFMLGVTGLTRGNFSTHMNRLVQAGYVEETKGYAGRRPLTEYRLTGGAPGVCRVPSGVEGADGRRMRRAQQRNQIERPG